MSPEMPSTMLGHERPHDGPADDGAGGVGTGQQDDRRGRARRLPDPADAKRGGTGTAARPTYSSFTYPYLARLADAYTFPDPLSNADTHAVAFTVAGAHCDTCTCAADTRSASDLGTNPGADPAT
jgi:hypothetical protein